MHPIRFLSKAGIKSQQLDCADGGKSSGRGFINSSDAAHCLSGLSPMLTPFAFWRFCADDTQLKKVRGNVAVKAMRISRERGFKIKNTTIAGISDAALAQLVQPICTACDGSPYRKSGDKVLVCSKCKGKAKKPLSVRQISDIANISHRAFSDNHQFVFDELLIVLNSWEASVVVHVRERMGF